MVATYDLIVIGLGINGAGIARDAALRGLKVLALEMNDLGAETSSWNSRLLHGGLNYLDQGELGLVRTLQCERDRLLRNAPHLVRPRPLVMPLRRGSRRTPFKVRMSLIAYDLLSMPKALAHHRMLSVEETLIRVPGLGSEGLLGSALFWDCELFYPERLTLENVLSARTAGAEIRTHTRVDRPLIENGRIRGVAYTDLMENTSGEARAPVVLNATGPWADRVLATLGLPQGRRVSGLKGSHIIVDHFPGAPDGHILCLESRDGMPRFVIPWNGVFLIGTTERPFEGDPAEAVAEDDEVDQLIEDVNAAIPTAGLTRNSVLYTYAGVRPLFHRETRRVGERISRHFVILDHGVRLEGLLSVVGGKLTMYRELAQQAVDLVFFKLGRRPPRCRTATLPLPGAEGDLVRFGWNFIMRSGLPEPVARRLVRIYGTRVRLLEEIWNEATELKEPLAPDTLVLRAEVVMAFRHELARTLGDALLRRTLVGLEPNQGRSVTIPAAAVTVQYLDWSESHAKAELARYERQLERFRVPELNIRK